MAGITGLTGWVGVVLDAPEARTLAYFYRDLFGWPLASDEPGWCTIRVPDAPANLAFQTERMYERPTWPATPGRRQMMLHLDVGVRDLAAAVEDAVALGAVLAAYQPQDDVRVLLDPAGHPFCLYLDRDQTLSAVTSACVVWQAEPPAPPDSSPPERNCDHDCPVRRSCA